MGIFGLFRKPDPLEIERQRRAFLQTSGRITDGRIIDSETKSNGGEIVFYRYTLNGVDFESSEALTAEQQSQPLKYAPGMKIGVRYDPKNQGNSMLE